MASDEQWMQLFHKSATFHKYGIHCWDLVMQILIKYFKHNKLFVIKNMHLAGYNLSYISRVLSLKSRPQ